MSIDLSEFHDIFFEECTEGLSVMETGLLTLENGADVEEINSIFRAAHSIKGGGASFGFSDIADFTHIMETLLDEMRDGRRDVSREIVDLLLESVDVLRDMVTAAKNDDGNDSERVSKVQKKLECVLAGEDENDKVTPDEAAPDESDKPAEYKAPEQACGTGWNIFFKPYPDMLKAGNDPARIIRELGAMGELQVECDTSQLPSLKDMDPQQCYLSWTMKLRSDVAETDIRELFSWIEDECELRIEPIGGDDQNLSSQCSPEDAGTTSDASLDTASQEDENNIEKSLQKAASGEGNAKVGTAEPSEKSAEQKQKPKSAGSSKESGSIRVSIDKVDALINMVGELVITQSMLSQIGSNLEECVTENIEKLLDGISQLERNTRELQEGVLQIRMLPISFSFSRFPRLVRDLSKSMGKDVELKMTGEHTEVDKNVLEKIADPLVHLVRNALDHGIETPDVRKSKDKAETGVLELCAYHEGGDIIIKVIDDGAGLDRDRILAKAIDKGLASENDDFSDERIYNLIFMPGFSTAEQISDVSGRGVGMDVVRRNVRDLGGNVSIGNNPGAGSTVTIRLPLTLAILDGQLVKIGNETYIVSLVSIVESLQMKHEHISSISGQTELYRLREEYIPIIRLKQLFGTNQGTDELLDGLLVVVESEGQRVGLFVDDLLGQQQVVIKSLETNFKQIRGISGATILGDGTVALIMDVPGLMHRHFETCGGDKRYLVAA